MNTPLMFAQTEPLPRSTNDTNGSPLTPPGEPQPPFAPQPTSPEEPANAEHNAEPGPVTPAGQNGAGGAEVASRITAGDIRPWLEHTPLRIARYGILSEEAELYFQVLAYVRDLPPGELQQAAREFMQQRWQNSRYRGRAFDKFPVFQDLYLHPQEYQGRPFTLTGHVQRTVVSPAGENEFGIKNLCEVWLYTEDSQQHPTVVLTTSLPENFPTGEQVVDLVTVTGYLFRMYNYKARDQGRYAPLMMAHILEWVPPEQRQSRDSSWFWLLVSGGVLVLVASLLASYFHSRPQPRRHRKPPAELPPEIYSAPEDRSEVKFPRSSGP